MFRTYCCLAAFASLAALAGLWASSAASVPLDRAARRAVAAPAVKKLPLVDQIYEKIDFAGFDDPRTTLAEALDHLMNKHGFTFDINEKAFKYEMLNDVLKTPVADPNAILPMKARLADVLERIIARLPVPSGATWLLRRDHVEITTWDFAQSEIYPDGAPNRPKLLEDEKPVFLGQRLPLLQIDLDNRPLPAALIALAERTGWNIVLDAQEAGKEKTAITARFRNVPLDTAVRIIASTAGLAVVELDNVLFVTTREKTVSLRAEHARARQSDRERERPFVDD